MITFNFFPYLKKLNFIIDFILWFVICFFKNEFKWSLNCFHVSLLCCLWSILLKGDTDENLGCSPGGPDSRMYCAPNSPTLRSTPAINGQVQRYQNNDLAQHHLESVIFSIWTHLLRKNQCSISRSNVMMFFFSWTRWWWLQKNTGKNTWEYFGTADIWWSLAREWEWWQWGFAGRG